MATAGKIPTLGFTAGSIGYVTLLGFSPNDTGEITFTPDASTQAWGNPQQRLRRTSTGGSVSNVISSTPYNYYAAVTVDDNVNLTRTPCDALYVGSGGDVTILTTAGLERTFVDVQTGQILQVEAIRVLDTGTTADALVALYYV